MPIFQMSWAVVAAIALVISGCSGAQDGRSVLGQNGTTASIGARPTAGGEPASQSKTLAKVLREVHPSQDSIPADGYIIGPQDVLEISVYQAPDLTKTVQVAEGGQINLPLVGDVRAGGITARALEHELKAKYGARYLQNPQITVFVREFNSQRVTVEGAVEKPGVYPYRGQVSLLQLIATAGGVRDVADGSNVLVLRTTNGKREGARFNVDDIKTGTASDPPIKQGDVVIVGASSAKKLYNDILKVLPVVGVFGGLL